MNICVDFDGTIVKHEFPKIGEPIPGALESLKVLQKVHNIILFTMRSGHFLKEAVNYLEKKGIVLYGVNTNPKQLEWTSSPKAFGDAYIDDAAIGCPLIFGKHFRPYVDWEKVMNLLVSQREIKINKKA